MSEILENNVYKNCVKTALKENKDQFCPFRKEKQMEYLFSKLSIDFQKKGLKVLDACCGYGRLTHFLNELDSEQFYTGVDFVEELIEQGRNNFSSCANIEFQHYNVLELSEKYDKEFDITINYKTMYCLPYYETLIEQLVKVTKNKIYITSPFYEGDIEYITKIYIDAKTNSDSFHYLNSYSLPKFRQFCKSLGIKEVNDTNMRLDFDIPAPDVNKLQTYTIMPTTGERLEVTGNILQNWKLIELVL